MAWEIAPSLKVLRDQINKAYPKRNKASDGVIGDAAHAKTASDHNPNAQGVVCAFDITHDPSNGFDADKFAETQRKNPHPNLKYMVWNKRICSRKYGWTWRPSSGHTSHIHVSVGVGSDGKSAPGTYENTTSWNIGENMSADKLTKDEVIEIHNAYFGGNPGVNYDYHHVGGPLEALIFDWKKSADTLKNRVDTKKLIKPSECPTVTPAPPNECKCDCDKDAIAEAVVEKLKGRLES